MDHFVGRSRELAILERFLERARRGGRTGRHGHALLMRGRRRVGKSRLAEEFIERAGVPSLYFTASAQSSLQADLNLFVEAGRESDLPGAHLFDDQRPQTWDSAMQLMVATLPRDTPAVVVLDEMPYLIARDSGFEGTLQKIFDRMLLPLPVLLLCIGSDLAMMEALNGYNRPFHQRASEMVVPPLSPADIASTLDLPAAESFDAYLVSGGLPLILDEWPNGADLSEYLADAVTDPTSALIVSGERALAAEVPAEAQARLVLGALGSGERTYSLIARAAGDLNSASLNRSLGLLTAKRLVEATVPLSTRPSRETRYAIADPHLRFWLAFLGPYLPEIERGRGDITLQRIKKSWSSWRGRAVEPVLRESIRRLPEEMHPAGTQVVGGYWTRTNDPEIDLVGADREPIAKSITMVGSIKWQDNRGFDGHDLGRLLMHRAALPGADPETPLVAVSRVESTVDGVRVFTPEELLAAWT